MKITAAAFLTVLFLWTGPVFADPPPPPIDWREIQDLLNEDPDLAVGEQMC